MGADCKLLRAESVALASPKHNLTDALFLGHACL